MNNRLATGEKLLRRNIIPLPVCVRSIMGHDEIVDHLFLCCSASRNIWDWMSDVFNVDFFCFYSVLGLLKWAAKQNFKNTVGLLRLVVVLYALWILWYGENELVFELSTVPEQQMVATLRKMTSRVSFLMKGRIKNKQEDDLLLQFFKITPRFIGVRSLKGGKIYYASSILD